MKNQQVKKSKNQQVALSGRFKGDLPDRTYEFAKVILDLIDELPQNTKGWAVAKQLVRCGTSIGANTSEASQAMSNAEFVHRCSIARKEASETRFWLRLCRDKGLLKSQLVDTAIGEVDELLRILGTIVRQITVRNGETPT